MEQVQPIALVMGGTGFIGSHVTRALIEEGWEVIHFGPPGPPGLPTVRGEPSKAVRRIDGSATHPGEVKRAVVEVRPDVVVSAIGHNIAATGLLQSSETDVLAAISVNSIGLRNILEAASEAGVDRVIWTSSVVAYGPPDLYGGRPVTEADVLRPVTSYGLTKALAEQISLFYRDSRGLDACALRIPLVFGPGRWYGGVLGSLMSFMSSDEPPPSQPLRLTSEQFDLVYAKDVADAILGLAAFQHRLAPAYNLRGFTTDFRAMVDAIEAERRRGSIPAQFTSEPLQYPLMSDGLIRREIGFTCAYELAASLQDFRRFSSKAEPDDAGCC